MCTIEYGEERSSEGRELHLVRKMRPRSSSTYIGRDTGPRVRIIIIPVGWFGIVHDADVEIRSG